MWYYIMKEINRELDGLNQQEKETIEQELKPLFNELDYTESDSIKDLTNKRSEIIEEFRSKRKRD